MNIKLVFCTKTHHSQRIAEAIAAACKLSAQNVTENPVLKDVDLLILVGGIYGSESMPEMISFAKALDQNNVRKVALVTSCVSGRTSQKSLRILLMNKGIIVVDEFICQGSLLLRGLGHPNPLDVENAVKYAKEVTEVIGSQR